MADKLQLISNALILIGDVPINSLEGGGRRETVARNLYDNIVQNEITKHRWGFARTITPMQLSTEQPADPQGKWRHIHQLPSDLLFLINVEHDNDYQLYGDKLYSKTSQTLYADYIRNMPESEWPVYFAKMIEYALAVDFAASIRDSATASQDLVVKYVNQSRMARYTDSQQYPTERVVSNPFTDVRY